MINVECKGYKGKLKEMCQDRYFEDWVTYSVTIEISDDITINISDCELEDIHFISE